ncbi:MAG: hypothetical protein AAF591_22430 [Verrucomicrobiota bacterium]
MRIVWCVLGMAFGGVASVWGQSAGGEAEERVFRDVDGREIRAVIQGVDDGFVFLKRGGTVYKLPLERLSESDRAFAKDWGLKNVRYQLQVRAEPWEDKMSMKELETNWEEDETTVESWAFQVDITNRGGADISDIEGEFEIHVRRTDTARVGGDSSREESPYIYKGKLEVESLPAGKQTRVLCGPVSLFQREWIEHRTVLETSSSGSYYTETDDEYETQYELEGVSLRLFQRLDDEVLGEFERPVLDWKSEDTKVKKLDWDRAKPLPTAPERKSGRKK